MEHVLQYEICFHFDTDKHSIAPKLFIEAVRLYEVALKEVTSLSEIENVNIDFQLITAEQGSFLAKVIVYIGVVGGILTYVENSKTINALLVGSTGKNYEEHIIQLGKGGRETTQNLLSRALTMPAQEIEAIPDYEILNPIWSARNAFFQSCKKDTHIQGFGLSAENVYPVKRSDFNNLIIIIEEKPELEHWEEVTIEVDSISLRKEIKWSGRNIETDEKLDFYFLDYSFKERVEAKKIIFPSKLRMQVIQIKGTNKIYALHVIAYESESFNYLSEDALEQKKQWILNKEKKEQVKKKEELQQATLFEK